MPFRTFMWSRAPVYGSVIKGISLWISLHAGSAYLYDIKSVTITRDMLRKHNKFHDAMTEIFEYSLRELCGFNHSGNESYAQSKRPLVVVYRSTPQEIMYLIIHKGNLWVRHCIELVTDNVGTLSHPRITCGASEAQYNDLSPITQMRLKTGKKKRNTERP